MLLSCIQNIEHKFLPLTSSVSLKFFHRFSISCYKYAQNTRLFMVHRETSQSYPPQPSTTGMATLPGTNYSGYDSAQFYLDTKPF